MLKIEYVDGKQYQSIPAALDQAILWFQQIKKSEWHGEVNAATIARIDVMQDE